MKKLVSLVLAALLVCALMPTPALAYDAQAGGTNAALPPVTDPDWQSPFNDTRLAGKAETGLLPAMGWNSWNAFQTNINAGLIKSIADSFIRLGLDKVGYEYVVIDDGCYNASLVDGNLSNHRTNFPLGFKDMSDYVHDLGLKYGMYQDSGARTCGGQPGAYGREDLFAKTMVDWGVDYIKYDFCGNTWDNDKYGRAPNIRSLTVRAPDGGFEQKINALDAVASGSVTRDTTNNFVSGIGIGATAATPTTPYSDITFTVTAPAAGTYSVVIENSANGTGNSIGRYLMLDVNGTRRFETLVPSTGSLTTMQNTETSVELAAGENTLRIYNVKRAESALYSMAAFKDALVKAGGESVRYSICEWGYNSPWTWAHKVGDSYRITTDIANKVHEGQYSWMKYQYDRAVILDKYTGLDKAWADPDMLVVGLKDTDKGMVDGVRPNFTHAEDIQHFTAWCMMNAPLMLGMDLTKVEVGDPVWRVITNRDVIALNQDPLGVQAKRLKTTANIPAMDAFTTTSRMDIIAKPLADGDVAVMFVNVGSTPRSLGINADEILAGLAGKLADEGAFAAAGSYAVKDLWSKERSTLGRGETLEMTVASHDSRTFRLTPIGEPAPLAEGTPVFGTYSAGAVHWADLNTVFFGNDGGETADAVIEIDPATTFQEYDGVGMSLEETSIANLWKLSKETREETLRALVEDWGIDIFRLVIGCCDCNERYPFWSLDDTPDNGDDFDFTYFSLAPDHEQHIVETVQFLRALDPDVKFFASAWSAPAWMKEIRVIDGDNGFVREADGSYKVMREADGSPVRRYRGWVEWNTYTLPSGAENRRQEQMNYLRDDCIDAFAEYYLRYVLAYKELGVDIYALTILNEPGADVIYPAMNMTIEQHQRLTRAIKQKFIENKLDTQLWAHDWNINDWYSQKNDAGQTINDATEDNHYRVFEDSEAATAAEMLALNDAVAMHPYDGAPARLPTQVAPYIGELKIHQTETNEFGTGTLISWFNNGASSYSAWVPFTDVNGGIHRWTSNKNNDYEIPPAGGWRNRVGTTRHDGSNDYVTFTDNFWAWGQFSRYLASGSDRPGDRGAVRIASTPGTQRNVSHTAFKNPDGEIVLVLNNGSNQARRVKVTSQGRTFVQTLPGRSTVTLRWQDGVFTVAPEETDEGARVVARLTNPSESDVTGVFVLAAYDARTGALAAADAQTFTAAAGGHVRTEFALDMDLYPPEVYVYRAFCWDEDLIPVTETLVLGHF
ncbi:MAG: hypothetical protein LBH86_06700 [Oscillospiraceae bacterium]|jgi:alpha-galactosidase|nr:hypothetical protein [Oscillospiraceae bacterium]